MLISSLIGLMVGACLWESAGKKMPSGERANLGGHVRVDGCVITVRRVSRLVPPDALHLLHALILGFRFWAPRVPRARHRSRPAGG